MLPIKGDCYLTQGYGLTSYALSPAGKKAYKNFPNGIHAGLDFGTHGVNLPTVATVKGKVVRAMLDGGWGNHTEILGEDGWRRQYAHQSVISVKVGDLVEAGQEIGKVGTTGASTGIHLHYGNRKPKLVAGIQMGWEYRDPNYDLATFAVPAPIKITKKLIRAEGRPVVYFFNGVTKFPISNWDTKLAFFGNKDGDIQVIPQDLCDKLPTGALIPSVT